MRKLREDLATATVLVIVGMVSILPLVAALLVFAPSPASADGPVEEHQDAAWTCDKPGKGWDCVMNATKYIEVNISEGGPQSPYGENATIGCHYQTIEVNHQIHVMVWSVPEGCEFHAWDVWKIAFMTGHVKVDLTVDLEASSIGHLTLGMDARSGSSYDWGLLIDHGDAAKANRTLNIKPETLNIVFGGTVWGPSGDYHIVIHETIFAQSH